MKHVRAICLDLDDTLWDLGAVISRAEAAVHGWFARHYPAVAARFTVADMAALRRSIVTDFPGREHDLAFLRRATFARLARECSYPEAIAADAFLAFQAERNRVTPFADVHPALARLQRRAPLVALTNGTADLAVIGLAPYFAAVFSAESVGAAKPDPRAFAAVCRQLGLEPAAVLHAGDHPHIDVAGARSHGMTAVWVDRGLHAWPHDVAAPDHVVGNLLELAERLGA